MLLTTRILQALLLSALSLGAQAEIVQYQFSGSVVQAPEDTLEMSTPFFGSWTVNTDQPGTNYESDEFTGKYYELIDFRVTVAGVELEASEQGRITVSTAEVPYAVETWPSGYVSEFVVDSGYLGDVGAFNTTLRSFAFLLAYDGLNIWDDYALPGIQDLDTASAFFAINTFGDTFFGGIDSVTRLPVVVPLMPSIQLLLVPFALMVMSAYRHRT